MLYQGKNPITVTTSFIERFDMEIYITMFLPLTALLCVWLAIKTIQNIDWRIAFVEAIILWSTFILLLTEALSLFQAIKPATLIFTWAAAILLGLASVCWHPGTLSRLTDVLLAFPFSRLSIRSHTWIPVAPVLIIAVITLIIGIVSPPNNWDSMTYHMSRVEQWRANASVSHYPTNNLWQISHTPFAEFVLLHFQTLGYGSDRIANLVQWLFCIGAMAAAWSLTGLLGGAKLAQNTSALAIATTPIIIMEMTSTQNDLVGGFFVIATAFFAFKIGVQPNNCDKAYLSLAIALAIATKGTAFVLLPPFAMWALWVTYRSGGVRAAVLLGSLVAGAVLVLNGGHWLRNFQLFGYPLGDPVKLEIYKNQVHGLKQTILSLFLNTLMNMGTPFFSVNSVLEQTAHAVAATLGLSLTDDNIIYASKFPFHITLRTHDTFAGNALAVGLFAAAFCLTMLLRGVSSVLRIYALLCVSGWILFCFMLKWAPFHTRLQIPLFMLAAVLVGVWSEAALIGSWVAGHRAAKLGVTILSVLWLMLIAAINARLGMDLLSGSAPMIGFFACVAVVAIAGGALIVAKRHSSHLPNFVIVATLTLACLPWVLLNEARPIFSLKYHQSLFYTDRADGYFADRKYLIGPYMGLLEWLDKAPHCTIVGIKDKETAYEYPLWALSRLAGVERRFIHVGVTNASVKRLSNEDETIPCAIVALEQTGWSPVIAEGLTQARIFSDDPSVVLFQRSPSTDALSIERNHRLY